MAADDHTVSTSCVAAAVLLGTLAVGVAPGPPGGEATGADPRALAAHAPWDRQFETSFAPGALTDAAAAPSAIICDD